MIDKPLVDSFLRLNYVGANASAEEITKVLTQAHWPPLQIREALWLRGITDTAEGALSAPQHSAIFRPDMPWSTSALSALLGTDVVIDPAAFHASIASREKQKELGKKILIGMSAAIIALILTGGIAVALTYWLKVGPFYVNTTTII